jgi:diacylglycerol kinase (ATP)
VSLNWNFLRRERKKRVFVVVNPAAGQVSPNLKVLNTFFHKAGWDWEMGITREMGDGHQLAERAVERGFNVVAAYGGDGTITDVSAGLLNTGVPLAILPGGTGNTLSLELGIPFLLTEACKQIVQEEPLIRKIDMGKANDHYFLLRLGIGFEAVIVQTADRQTKDRLGILAYVLGVLEAVNRSQMVRYKLEVDGALVETEGLACTVANAATIGIPGLSLSPQVRMDDGLLDVFLFRKGDLLELTTLAASMVSPQTMANPLPSWRCRSLKVTAEPSQGVESDGDIITQTPVEISVIPQSLLLIMPSKPTIFARKVP